MNSTLFYTFRTNKYINEFCVGGHELFVFRKLKDDIITFQKLINKIKPRHVIGVANVKNQSRIETRAINSFGNNGKVNRNGKGSYKLYVPLNINFSKSRKPTNSFCNWTMYRISELIDPKHTKLSFLHFNKEDIPKVVDYIKSTE